MEQWKAETGGGHNKNGKGKKTHEMAIKDLRNEIEEPWCYSESMAPVRNIFLAIFLLFMNILVPGFGTVLSGCFVAPDLK